jgi:hypothetical protein
MVAQGLRKPCPKRADPRLLARLGHQLDSLTMRLAELEKRERDLEIREGAVKLREAAARRAQALLDA